MFYPLLKFLVHWALKVYFRKIHFSGRERLPDDRPLIIAVNHPTAFIDPILIPVYVRPVLHFILRGDFFSSPLKSWFLRQVNTIPIFRFRDRNGFEGLRKNREILDACAELLHQGKHILILAEGVARHEKRLRPIQKGLARMAFRAYERFGNERIAIVPTGVNYSDSHRWRSEAFVEFGEPILLKDYLPLYDSDPRRALAELTREIERRMRRHIVHIADPADDPWVDLLLEMQRNEHPEPTFPLLDPNPRLLHREIQLVETLNALPPDEKAPLKEMTLSYAQALQRAGLRDEGVAEGGYGRPSRLLGLLLGFPIAFAGGLLNGLPLWAAKKIADWKVRKFEFHASVRVAVGMFLWLFWFLGWLAAAAWTGNSILAGTVLAIPVLGVFALFYRDQLLPCLQEWRFQRLPAHRRAELKQMRSSLLMRLKKHLGQEGSAVNSQAS